MKKTIPFAGLILVLMCLCPIDLSAFIISKASDSTQIVPPQYSTIKTRFKSNKTNAPINLTKLSKWSLVLGLLSPVGFSRFLYVLYWTGTASIAGLFLSITFACLAFFMANRVLKNQNATTMQRKRAKWGKFLGIFTICFILAALIFGESFL
jgi:hypothetical protein